MIRTPARLRAHGRHPWLLLAVPAAAAAVITAAGCSSSAGSGAGPYGSAPSGVPAAHASAAGSAALALRGTSLGTIVTTGQGFTVYAFDADRGGMSACTGACAAARPPVIATGPRIIVTGGAESSLVGEITRAGRRASAHLR